MSVINALCWIHFNTQLILLLFIKNSIRFVIIQNLILLLLYASKVKYSLYMHSLTGYQLLFCNHLMKQAYYSMWYQVVKWSNNFFFQLNNFPREFFCLVNLQRDTVVLEISVTHLITYWKVEYSKCLLWSCLSSNFICYSGTQLYFSCSESGGLFIFLLAGCAKMSIGGLLLMSIPFHSRIDLNFIIII